MKPAARLLCATLFCIATCISIQAQAPSGGDTSIYPAAAPQVVAIKDEPHHRLVLQNDFVRVYNVSIPGLDATLMHQHDHPYLYLCLGAGDFINAVQGKPEVHTTVQDGETHYSPGGFAHIVRTDSGMSFHNITIELLHPQGTLRNLCKDVVPGSPLSCSLKAEEEKKTTAAESKTKSESQNKTTSGKSKQTASTEQSKASTEQQNSLANSEDVPYFESDELREDVIHVSGQRDYTDAEAKYPALLVAMTGANLDVSLGGEHLNFLHEGDVLWLPAGKRRRVVDFLGTHSSFMLLSFKDGATSAASR